MSRMESIVAPTAVRSSSAGLDVERVREDFPILHQEVHGHPLAYLDNAASAQKPVAVIEAVRRFCREDYSNIHRGLHQLSERATRAFEGARERVQAFLGAREAREIVFTRGTTEAINLVASTFGRRELGPGDEVLVTGMEHHSNIVPWQMICEEQGARLRVVPVDDAGEVPLEEYERRIGPKTKLVSIVHVSNALGTVNSVRRMVEIAHERNVPVLVDGAQAAPHFSVDVHELGCDFYAFSGHKLYGPSGIGVLYGRAEILEELPPYQGGGEMIRSVTFEKTTYKGIPHRFEAGTPNITGVVGLGAAIDYLEGIGLNRIAAHEKKLLDYATERVGNLAGLRRIGTAREKAGVLSFVIDGVHPHDIGTILDHQGVAIRAGHHCAQPVMERFGVPATARASFGLYNTTEEVDRLVEGLEKVVEVFA